VTIHDSVVTLLEHAGAVTAVMEEAFGSAGVRPTIEVTPFGEEAQEARRGGPDERV
jgi:hypothetical protein